MRRWDKIKMCAARAAACGALAISIVVTPMTAYAAEDAPMLQTGIENEEGFRLFKWRTLKALNKIRDVGLTPQAIVENLSGDNAAGVAQDAQSAISGYADDIGQDIADAVQERTQEIVQDATDAATEAARRQMNNWVDSIGESIGNALRDLVDSILGTSSGE